MSSPSTPPNVPPADRRFIVDLTLADWMTVSGYFLVWCGLWCGLWGWIPWAISFLTVAMLIDALDGMVARRLGIARPFGRYLGSFVDLVNYTVAPPLILWKLGFSGVIGVTILWIYSICGLLRLARFNEIGNIQQDGALAYLGLPVFWVHFVLMGLYILHAIAGGAAFFIATAVSLPILSYCFILNRPFWKPQNYTFIAVVTLLGALVFAVLGFYR
jgi:phosphatidylserine synthase